MLLACSARRPAICSASACTCSSDIFGALLRIAVARSSRPGIGTSIAATRGLVTIAWLISPSDSVISTTIASQLAMLVSSDQRCRVVMVMRSSTDRNCGSPLGSIVDA